MNIDGFPIIKFKRLHPAAKIPVYATKGAACFDFYSIENAMLSGTKDVRIVKTGLAVEIPEGYELQIRPRSGQAVKQSRMLVHFGTIDSDYRGEIGIIIRNLSGLNSIDAGDRIAQGIIQAVPKVILTEAKELSETERGMGGFGSTGR